MFVTILKNAPSRGYRNRPGTLPDRFIHHGIAFAGKRRPRPETRTPEPEKRISGCSHAPKGLSPRQSEALQARAQLNAAAAGIERSVNKKNNYQAH
jgi:hypothetical protein